MIAHDKPTTIALDAALVAQLGTDGLARRVGGAVGRFADRPADRRGGRQGRDQRIAEHSAPGKLVAAVARTRRLGNGQLIER